MEDNCAMCIALVHIINIKLHMAATVYPRGQGTLLKDKEDLFIGPQEFVVGYSKAPEQPQSSARPVCHSHAMTRTGREPATICIVA